MGKKKASTKTKNEALKASPKMPAWKKITLFLPLLLSTSWMAYLQMQTSSYGGVMLSPLPTSPLMIALVLFTLGYLIFLSLLFSDNLRNFFHRSASKT